MLTKNFNRFLKRKLPSISKNFNKKYEGEGKMKTKEVTCYECKKPGHIKSECPKLKFKNKGAKDKKKAFKATWDNSSESELEEDQDEVANLCFMAFEDDIKAPFSSISSFYEFNDDFHDNNNDDDGTYMVSNLMSKYKSLLSKKNHYKHKLTSLTKEFENLKNKFSSLTVSHVILANDLKNSNSLEEQLKKVNDENH